MPHEILLREGLEALRGGCLNGVVVVSCSCLQKPLAEKRKARESACARLDACVWVLLPSILFFSLAPHAPWYRAFPQHQGSAPRMHCRSLHTTFAPHVQTLTRFPSQTTNVKSPPTTPTPQLVLKPLYRDTHDRVGTQHVLELDQRYVYCPPVLLAGVVSLPSFLPAACAT